MTTTPPPSSDDYRDAVSAGAKDYDRDEVTRLIELSAKVEAFILRVEPLFTGRDTNLAVMVSPQELADVADFVLGARPFIAAQEARVRRLREALGPFAEALEAADARYRKRGDDPDTFSDDADLFEIVRSLLVGGKLTVPPELQPLTRTGIYRAARRALEGSETDRG